jgi:mannitol/fructose-specific phosphotransferase system IIA component (Ntr-type)
MLLSEIFNERSIMLNLEADSKEDAFMELIEAMAAAHPELDKSKVLSVVLNREKKMDTVVASGVAVPHGYYPDIGDIIGAVGISKTGIDYEVLNNEPVHCVFLLLMGENAREDHLRTLSRILTLINSSTLASIRAAKNAMEVHGILSQFR